MAGLGCHPALEQSDRGVLDEEGVTEELRYLRPQALVAVVPSELVALLALAVADVQACCSYAEAGIADSTSVVDTLDRSTCVAAVVAGADVAGRTFVAAHQAVVAADVVVGGGRHFARDPSYIDCLLK